MENLMFDNEYFDQWLTLKSNEILIKMKEQEKLTNDDMLALTLKAQSNHFHHMDIEFREYFKKLDVRFEEVNKRFAEVDKRFEQVDKRFEQMYAHVDKRFEQVDKRFEQMYAHFDKRFEQVDKRFQNQSTILMWGFGLFFTSQMALFLKLVLAP